MDLTPTGSVALDIGGDIGALVVSMDPRLLGREVEARPLDQGGVAAHASVLARALPDGVVHAVVIPGLVAGRYAVGLCGEPAFAEVVIGPGAVTELDERENPSLRRADGQP